MSRHYAANHAVLTSFFPRTAAALDGAAPDVEYTTSVAATGSPVLVRAGRPLDSLRDPARGAGRVVAEAVADRVVLLGLGSGYVAEALTARGVTIVAIVDRTAALRAALETRDLTQVIGRVPLLPLENIDRRELARLRTLTSAVVVHGPSAVDTPELAALGARWGSLPVARRPRVLTVGPIYGGSLGIARAVADAVARTGADARFFDASAFGSAQRAIGDLDVPAAGRDELRGKLMLVASEAIVRLADAWRPDLVIALAQAPLGAAAVQALGATGAATAFWFVENERVLTYWRDVAPYYSHFYAIQPGAFLERLAGAGAPRPAYLPMACDPHRHVPVALTEEERARYGCDVSFAGAPYLNRRRVLATLADLGLVLWGEGWQTTPLAGLARGGGARFDHDEMLRIFAGSSVNVNLHSADHVHGLDPSPDYVNPRTFELAACGAFQLVDRRDPLPGLFDPGEIATFDSVSGLRRLVEHYRDRPAERAAMTDKARARALRDHTCDRRVAQIFDDALAPHLLAGLESGAGEESIEDALDRCGSGGDLSREEAVLRMVMDVRRTIEVLQ